MYCCQINITKFVLLIKFVSEVYKLCLHCGFQNFLKILFYIAILRTFQPQFSRQFCRSKKKVVFDVFNNQAAILLNTPYCTSISRDYSFKLNQRRRLTYVNRLFWTVWQICSATSQDLASVTEQRTMMTSDQATTIDRRSDMLSCTGGGDVRYHAGDKLDAKFTL